VAEEMLVKTRRTTNGGSPASDFKPCHTVKERIVSQFHPMAMLYTLT
jgi:hypothetical protein